MNASTTRAMVFSVKKEKNSHPPLILNNEIIPDVSSYCHLGKTLSNDLMWTTHISTIYENASKRLNLLKGLKFKLNRSTLNAMYYLTLIRPLMEYADFKWDGCSSESTNVLESIQHETAHLVTRL